MDLPNYNSTNYPLALRNQLSKLVKDNKDELKFHQKIVKEYFIKNKQARGLLICHSMGYGKTRIAVAISATFKEIDPTRKIVILSAKSLAENFRKEVTKYAPDFNTEKNLIFISLNASNMFSHIKNVNKSPDEVMLEKKLGDFYDDMKKSSLENSLLIVDEAHNLFNSISNGSKNAVNLYDLIMNTRNIKLIFLSGTPIINYPFELVPCFNMIRGFIDTEQTLVINKPQKEIKTLVKHNYVTLLPENYGEFKKFFIDKFSIKNKDKFTNRIFGLVSYYGDLYFEEGDKKDFPKELPTIVEYVPMSQEQFARYTQFRILENEEAKFSKKDTSRFADNSGSSSSYRVKSRQVSNYFIPEHALGPVRGNKTRERFLDKLTKEDLLNHNYSPKMFKMIENIKKSKGLGIVYSQFVSGEGIAIFAKILDNMNYVNYNQKLKTDVYDLETKNPVYAILSGEVDPDERSQIISDFNNRNGISLLLLSGAVAEGIDLKRVRHVHIMEPFWNYARINQVKTRAIRYKSHEDLPKEEQNVQTYIYISDYPKNFPENKKKEETTDMSLYKKSIFFMNLINEFMYALIEASIDCSIHYDSLNDKIKEKINCKLCSPDNNILFYPVVNQDMEFTSNCKPYTESNIKVDEIEIDGNKYYYKKKDDDIEIYKYNSKLQGYTKYNIDSNYANIYEKIMDLK
jgi:superfamily II DNA or RNA helicase